jgi:hypothetical protein
VFTAHRTRRRASALHLLACAISFIASGVLPLDVMLTVMRDEPLPDGKKPTDQQLRAATGHTEPRCESCAG